MNFIIINKIDKNNLFSAVLSILIIKHMDKNKNYLIYYWKFYLFYMH